MGSNGWWIILLFILLGGWNNGGYGGGASEIQTGFNQNAIINGLNTVTGEIGDVQQAICSGFANAEIANNNRQIANMQNTFNAQTAITQGMNNISMGLQNCCCENRASILECQGERNPNANTCIKLAAYLTILESLYPKEDKPTPEPIKTVETANNNDLIGDLGDTDFYRMIQGKKYTDVLAVVNELMDTVYIMNPKLYDGVMHELMKSG